MPCMYVSSGCCRAVATTAQKLEARELESSAGVGAGRGPGQGARCCTASLGKKDCLLLYLPKRLTAVYN